MLQSFSQFAALSTCINQHPRTVQSLAAVAAAAAAASSSSSKPAAAASASASASSVVWPYLHRTAYGIIVVHASLACGLLPPALSCRIASHRIDVARRPFLAFSPAQE
ncbi:hypothetical protein CGCVW01_v005118 [Colletotrichum viniferum]|nr:hypothetical protein CGCVW01_v005118 [Colletotrichum viniferum]